jgi:hypothetical protein
MKLSKWACAAALGLAMSAGQAEASVVIDIFQSGGNVVATGSGTIDLSGLTFFDSTSTGAALVAALGGVVVGPFGSADEYVTVSGPASFGPGNGGGFASSSSSGDVFGVCVGCSSGALFVPSGYVSGSALSGSTTFEGASFGSMGLTPGTYVYTWGSGADSLTVDIAAIPESGTCAMMTLGFAALGLASFRAARKNAARAA